MTYFQSSYEYISCSNKLTLTYQTGSLTYLQDYYRGFRAYYELIDLPVTCPNWATKTTQIPPITSSYAPPTYPVTKEVFSTILATDELMGAQKCSIPFKFNGAMVDKCLKDESNNGKFWCSTTPDYDQNKQKV